MVGAGGKKQGPATIQVEVGREQSENLYAVQGQGNKHSTVINTQNDSQESQDFTEKWCVKVAFTCV